MNKISNHRLVWTAMLAIAMGFVLSAGFATAEDEATPGVQMSDIVGIDLLSSGDAVRVEISARGPVSHRAFRMSNPDRFVVDLMGSIYRADSAPVAGDGQWVHKVRSSQYRISPSPVTRVVVELGEDTEALVEYFDGGLAIVVGPEGRASAGAAATPQTNDAVEMGWDESKLAPLGSAMELGSELPMDNWQSAPQDEARTAQPVRREDDASYARTFSVNSQNAEINTILRSIAEFSGTNIITSPRVQGQVTVSLTDVPWREALEVILRAHGFGYVEEHDVLRVDSMEKLREEDIAAKTATQRIDQIEQLTTSIVKVDFANADEIKTAINSMLTARGSVEVEPRTNSLVISDIPAVLETVENLARSLDTRTPQVHINALLVDLDTRVSREFGVEWGLFNVKPEDANFGGDLTVINPISEVAGQVRVGSIQDWGDVRAAIQALEKNNQAKIISNPRITTTNNREAEILVGQKIPLIVADQAGNAVTQLTTIGIRLVVTPHINSDRQITLDVHPEVSDLSSQATVQGGVIINTSQADTRVLVQNTETAVIAGLIRSVESTLKSGVPVLKDLPVIGALFRSETKTDNQRELVVFITPSIVAEDGGEMSDRERELIDGAKARIEHKVGE